MNEVTSSLQKLSIPRLLIPIGVILIVFGVIMNTLNTIPSNYIKIESIVSKTELLEEAHYDKKGHHIDAKYNVYVKYTVGKIEYEEKLIGIKKYKKNDKIIIYYNSEEPSQITQEKSSVLPIILIIVGIISFIIGMISAVISYKKIKNIKPIKD